MLTSCIVDNAPENDGIEYLISTKQCDKYIYKKAIQLSELYENIDIKYIDYSNDDYSLGNIAGLYIIKPIEIGEVGSFEILQILSNICSESISKYPASKLINLNYLDKLNKMIGESGSSGDDGYQFYMYSGNKENIYIHRYKLRKDWNSLTPIEEKNWKPMSY